MKQKIDIFRPIATVTKGCRGMESSDEHSQLHSSIFREKQLGTFRSGPSLINDPSDDDNFVVSFPSYLWPPNATNIADSESTDIESISSKRKRYLNHSVPLRVESSESSSAAMTMKHPSYYKIEMNGSEVQLSAGDDNSIKLTHDHNDNIRASGPKGNITRASPIAEQGIESQSLPPKAHALDRKWTVSEKGDIVSVHIKPVLFTRSSEYVKLSVPRVEDSDSTPPLISMASSDNLSINSNELILPESPPRMMRSLYDKSLFKEYTSVSISGKAPLCSPNQPSSPVNIHIIKDMSAVEEKRNLISQLLDFFNLTCGAIVCRDTNCLTSSMPVEVA
jgi:hypothetical protein